MSPLSELWLIGVLCTAAVIGVVCWGDQLAAVFARLVAWLRGDS